MKMNAELDNAELVSGPSSRHGGGDRIPMESRVVKLMIITKSGSVRRRSFLLP